MDLKIPGTNIDFRITPQYFLSVFDVYDREEDVGVYLNNYNPNDPNDLQKLFHEFLFTGKMVERYRLEHKAEIARVLANILDDESFDYSRVFDEASNDKNQIFLPSKWKIENPRQFFLEAHQALVDHWGSELGMV